MRKQNHPFVLWASCFLWLTSMFAIFWSLLLFFNIGEFLLITGNDFVNALVLLLGLIMLPANVYILYKISIGQKIYYKSKVFSCPLWICMLWIIIISLVGVGLCLQRMNVCHQTTNNSISYSMKNYRSIPKYKHFIDTLQWSLKCCGLNSYKDWFIQDWYDKIRNYEWDLSSIHKREVRKQTSVADSVPLSCCKSGTCVSNFLMELGTHSIHTKGCRQTMKSLIMISMTTHLAVFILVIIMQVILLKCIISSEDDAELSSEINSCTCCTQVRHLMPVNKKIDFGVSSETSLCSLDDESDDLEAARKHEAEGKKDDGNYYDSSHSGATASTSATYIEKDRL